MSPAGGESWRRGLLVRLSQQVIDVAVMGIFRQNDSIQKGVVVFKLNSCRIILQKVRYIELGFSYRFFFSGVYKLIGNKKKFIVLAGLLFAGLVFGNSRKPAKYVFLMIGDGMGATQRQAAEFYYRSCQIRGGVACEDVRSLKINSLPVTGITSTFSSNALVTDSAAAATALATGYKTRNGVISMDSSKTQNLKTLAEIAKEQGKKVGIISNVWINHATPAAFYSHRASRGMYYEIAVDLANSDMDYYGGGFAHNIGEDKRGDRPDPVGIAKENGFTVTSNAEELVELKPGAGKVWAYDETQHVLDYEIDRKENQLCLNDFVQKGIELLYTNNANGFFMMIEGGKIDWVCHANDAATAIKDTIAFDKVFEIVMDFYNEHKDETLIVITGDHECGGMKLSANCMRSEEFAKIIDGQKGSDDQFKKIVIDCKEQKMDFEAAKECMMKFFDLENLTEKESSDIKNAYIKGGDKKGDYTYGNNKAITIAWTKVLDERAGVNWTGYSHTGVAVLTTAIGNGQELFGGIYDNTDLSKKILKLMQSERDVPARKRVLAETLSGSSN